MDSGFTRMSPKHFFLFPYLKNKMKGQCFSTPEEAIDAYRIHVLEIPQSEWQKCFDNWFNGCKVYKSYGEYFEKQ